MVVQDESQSIFTNKKVDHKNFLLKKGRNLSSFCGAVEGRFSIECGKENINYLIKLCSLDSPVNERSLV